MAQNKLDIVNLALRELGHTPVEAFDESDEAETADGLYELARDEMLFGNRWSWLERRVQLTESALFSSPAEPPTETDADRIAERPRDEWTGESEARRTRRGSYSNEFNSPVSAIIQAIYATRSSPTPDTFSWKRQGGFIYASREELYADVTGLSAEPTFHRLFVNALVLTVAARLAIPLTEDPEIAQDLERKARMALRTAKRVDAQSQPASRITSFPYVRARVGGDRVRYGVGSYPL